MYIKISGVFQICQRSTCFLNKVPKIKRITQGQSASYLISQKYLKSLFVDNIQITLIIFFRNFNDYSLQYCLLLMIDKWKKVVDNKILGALLTDLSKAFDCICHDLLVAKFNAYGPSFTAIKTIQDYVTAKLWKSVYIGINQNHLNKFIILDNSEPLSC